MWEGGLVQFEIMQILQGSEAFVIAFNFCFTAISVCGSIAAVFKIIIKLITRS